MPARGILKIIADGPVGNDVMTQEFTLVPREIKTVDTRYRRIQTKFPVPESLPVFEQLYRYEPRAMRGQPPVLWDRAENFQVFDRWGNVWIDWTSGVLIANAGHGRKEIAEAIVLSDDVRGNSQQHST